MEVLKSSRKVLSSVDMLGNLQYFKSEKEELIQNVNYLESSINKTLFYSPIVHSDSPRDSVSSIPSTQEPSKKRRIMIKAIGSTFDGVAHITSRVRLHGKF